MKVYMVVEHSDFYKDGQWRGNARMWHDICASREKAIKISQNLLTYYAERLGSCAHNLDLDNLSMERYGDNYEGKKITKFVIAETDLVE